MLQAAIREGVTTTREDHGEASGEHLMSLGAEPGLQTSAFNVYDQIVHLSCLSDVIVSAIRKKGEAPWTPAGSMRIGDGPIWKSSAFLSPDGQFLRRVAIASSWNDDRHYSFARSWHSLGEVAIFGLPMQQATIVIGPSRDGKRHSHWTKGYLHPQNKKLRFRRRQDPSAGFKDSWRLAWREDNDQLSTADWLQAMYEDSVLQDLCFSVPIAVPDASVVRRLRDLAARRLDEIDKLETLPEQQLSTCDWPSPCLFRTPCHAQTTPSGKFGFVRVDELI